MSSILLADDSPHAQRMGERILREEGFEVVSLTDGETAMLRLADVDPDLVLADVFLPGPVRLRDLPLREEPSPASACARDPDRRAARDVRRRGGASAPACDAILKKPFEASVVMETIRPLLVEAASWPRGLFAGSA